MSRISKNSMTSAGVLIILGAVALYAGPNSLIVVVPAALVIWYGGRQLLENGRN
jgi:hypothetical protein